MKEELENSSSHISSAEERNRRKQLALEKTQQKEKSKKTVLVIIGSVVALCIVGYLTYLLHFVPKGHFDKATDLRKNGLWDEARAEYFLASQYGNSPQEIQGTYYDEGMSNQSEMKWNEAIDAFSKAGNYSDADQQITETHYLHANQLYNAGQYGEAYRIFKSIRDYKDVEKIIQEDKNIIAVRQSIKDACHVVGNTMTFGHYEQDGDWSDGKEEIEWIILDSQGNKVLLISKYALYELNNDKSVRNNEYSWQDSVLRESLNNKFYNDAFSDTEKTAIVKTQVDNSSSQSKTYKYKQYSFDKKYKYKTFGSGPSTEDYVFALSYAEAWKYFPDDESRACTKPPRKESAADSTDEDTDDNKSSWWLRNTGDERWHIALVGSRGWDGSTYGTGNSAGVRPALWIDLDKTFDIY